LNLEHGGVLAKDSPNGAEKSMTDDECHVGRPLLRVCVCEPAEQIQERHCVGNTMLLDQPLVCLSEPGPVRQLRAPSLVGGVEGA
jgi:hypothetical protein